MYTSQKIRRKLPQSQEHKEERRQAHNSIATFDASSFENKYLHSCSLPELTAIDPR